MNAQTNARTSFGLRLAVLALLAAAPAGCGSDVSFSAITSDLTPELGALSDRPVDLQRHYAYMQNTNMRALVNDFQRAFYIDQPSRLTPFPVVKTSGNP